MLYAENDPRTPGTQSAPLARMTRLPPAVGLIGALSLLLAAEGCSSTSAGAGALDGAATSHDAQGDAVVEEPLAADAGSSSGECSEAGGQCLIGDVICAVSGPQSCGGVTPAGLYCCLSNVADCGQPDATTYTCPAEAGAGASCKSAPVPIGAPNEQALQQAADDDDASYPAGCRVTFPACNNGLVPYCTCSGSGPGSSGWNCFY